ncbi:MAG: hypothetical protein JHC93_08510 [Parachlamydiales bacterium]|nr:hypothetical protein [Parachlamydiales bacterium]
MELITHTPWWVWIIFAYLIYIGIKASRSGYVPLFKTSLIPVLFTAWSIFSVTEYFGFNRVRIIQWLVAVALGSVLGWIIGDRIPIKVDKKKKAIFLPGSWFTLIMVLIIFVVKYYFGYSFAVFPERLNDPLYANVYVLFSGFFTGIFVGRFLCFCYKYSNSVPKK